MLKPCVKYSDIAESGKLLVEGAKFKRVLSYRNLLTHFSLYSLDDAHPELCKFILNTWLSPGRLEDTIYIGISRKAKITEIEKYLLPELKRYLIPHAPKIRDDKWKYYLIVYDLKRQHNDITFEDVSILLMNTYPEITVTKITKDEETDKTKKIKTKINTDKYFCPKNCSNFHKAALSLISGEYKQYLYL